MDNLEVVKVFRDIAKILRIKDENPFRIRAYERAADSIEGLSENIEDFIKDDRLTQIPGIGSDLSEKIKELVKTGRIASYEALKKTVPQGVLDLLDIPSVGPKTVKLLYEKLKIRDISELEEAIKNNKLKGIFGIREKTIGNILKGIEIVKKGRERITLAQAQLVADEFITPLKKSPYVKKIAVSGSLRRRKETVRDIDILVVSDEPEKVMSVFTSVSAVKDVLASGGTKASVRTKEDVQVDCRVVEQKSFGSALLYFTGSKNFNIKLRQLAIKKGFKVNEYGIFKGDKFVAGNSEEEIFKLLKMSYIEPELREDTGEIELAQEFKLPDLIELKDLKGDLHAHSSWSDGSNSIKDLAEAAKNMGLSYIAITDHSRSLKVARGLSVADLRKKRIGIEGVNKGQTGFRVLYGTEVDIGPDGDIDYPDSVLRDFDIVVAAVHTGFRQSREQLTRRIISACRNKYVHIIAHPTGRLWGVRDAYDIDLAEILKAAGDTNTQLEINAFAQRLDLDGLHARRAKEAGVRLAIGTDAHELSQLQAVKFGIFVSRRGWLSKEDVINTLTAEDLLKTIRK